MQNKFNILTKELNILIEKINQAPLISQISSKDFSNYKSLILKKELLESKISKLSNFKENIVNKYSSNNEKWLYDDNMNCRKYCKLEQHAAYVRDKKLYTLGFLDFKPISPFKEKFIQPISDIISPKFNLLKNNLKSFFDNTISKKFQNLFTTHSKSNSIKPIICQIKKEADLQTNSFLSNLKVESPKSSRYPYFKKSHDIQDYYDIAL